MTITDYYVATDAMGSVTAILDDEGNVLERRSYDAFGEMTCMTPDGTPVAESPTSVDVGFQGQISDETTGLYQMGFRWYNPALGCWASPDSAGLCGGPNAYSGFGNSPNTYTDCFGLEPSITGDYLNMYSSFKRTTEQSIASCKRERAENIAALDRLAAANTRPIVNCPSQKGCRLISIIVELADPCDTFPENLVGHAGVGVDNSYYDYGPNNSGSKDFGVIPPDGAKWWANPQHASWYGYYSGKDSAEVTLKNVKAKIGQLADNPTVLIEYCACNKEASIVQSYWDNLNYEISAGTCKWSPVKRSCTAEAMQSTTGSRKIGVTPFVLIEASIEGIRSSCGDSKGAPPNVRVIKRSFNTRAR